MDAMVSSIKRFPMKGSGLAELTRQVDDGHVDGGDTEGHASELALETGDDLGQSLWLEESTTAWVAVMAWAVVMRAS